MSKADCVSKTKKAAFLAESLILSLAVWANYGLSPRDPLLLAVGAVFFFLRLFCWVNISRREYRASVVAGALLSVLLTLGKLDEIILKGHLIIWLPIRFVGFWALFSLIIMLLFIKTSGLSLCDSAQTERKKCLGVFFSSFVLIFACFIFWLLCEYPGGITPDSNNQLLQITGQLPYSNHHPVVHTWIIALFFRLGLLIAPGDQSFAIALYHGFQALFLSASFAFLIETLYEMRIKKWVITAVLLLFVILPYHGSFGVTMWKDVWFGAIVLVWCLAVLRLLLRSSASEMKKPPVFESVLFCVFSLGMCLFRGNGIYAYAVSVPFVILIFRKKNVFISVASAAALIAALVITGPVYDCLGIAPTETAEPLSMPIQHISRAIAEGAELTDAERELISKLVDVDMIPELYDPTLSDPVKEWIKAKGDMEYLSAHKLDYLKMWFDIGMRYPGAYVRAQLDQTRGYWYPDVSHWVMGSGQGLSVGMEIEKNSNIPALENLADRIYQCTKDLPVIGLIYSIGAAAWALIIIFALSCVRAKSEHLVLFVPVFAVLATILLASPVYAEFRYAYSVFTTLPLLGVLPFYQADGGVGN